MSRTLSEVFIRGFSPYALGILPFEHSTPPGISVVIPNWNGRVLLEKFLPSVVGSVKAFEVATSLPAEIIVSDDDSSDDSGRWLKEHYPTIRFLAASPRRGFSPTVNRGVRAANYSWVFVLNNDVAMEPGTLIPLFEHFKDPSVFGVVGQVYDARTGLLIGGGQYGEFRRGFLGVHERFFVDERAPAATPAYLTFWGNGCSTIYDREKFLAMGGFEELFAPYGWEDVEIGVKAWKQGFSTIYEPRSAIWHARSATIGSRFGRRRVRAIYERNRLWAHWMHLDTSGQFLKHGGMLLLKLLLDPLALRWDTWSSFFQALRKVRPVRARRKDLLAKRRLLLTEIFEKIDQQATRPEVQPYRDRTAPVRPCPWTF
ncbi:MAG: glycosyltransferase family 2 protein [Candidatus Acidiferrum sp.]